MNAFEMRTNWPDALPEGLQESIEDQVTAAALALTVDGTLLTAMTDADGQRRDGPNVSAYRLAEWLVANWWRLRWEAGPPRSTGRDLDWQQAHRTVCIGGGWLWPRITLSCDGRRMTAHAEPTRATETEPLSYAGGHGQIQVQAFEDGVDTFVESVLGRLDERGGVQTWLSSAYSELQSERRDPNLSRYRKIEALLGHNVDETPNDHVSLIMAEEDRLGHEAVAEIAADPALRRVPSADDLARVARRSGHEVCLEHGVTAKWLEDQLDATGSVAPWTVGVDAATALRSQEALCGPLDDRRLAEMYGVSAKSLAYQGSADMAFALAGRCDETVVLRARMPTGRRFELARLLADRLLVRTDDLLRPANGAGTFRQGLQRAFAAELLCPFEDLREHLGSDHSQEAMKSAADHFRVSPWVVTRRLSDHGLVPLEVDDIGWRAGWPTP